MPEEGGREPRTQAKLKPKLVSDAYIHNVPGSRGRGQGRAWWGDWLDWTDLDEAGRNWCWRG